MAPVIRTHSEVVRWLAVQTAYTAAFILPATAAACFAAFGGDLSRTLSGWDSMRFCLCLALAETLLFTPLVAIRSVDTLRQLNLARDELDRLAGADPLTGLLNRRGFERAAADLAAAARGAPIAALVCDVDAFKRVNDRFGHEFGDAGLRRLANILRAVTGDRGFALGRLGGDEFVVLMVGVTLGEASALAEQIRAAMSSEPVEANGAAAFLTVSAGVATAGWWEGDVTRLIGAADAALYQAKRDGRDRVVVAREPLRAAA